MTTTSGSAKWQGGIKDGKGAISTKSGALKDYPYGFASRFEGKPGSNPEELLGAAHAACFTMALSLILGEAKLTAEQMETRADVTLEKVGDGFSITSVHLTLNAKVPGADNAKLQELAAFHAVSTEQIVGRLQCTRFVHRRPPVWRELKKKMRKHPSNSEQRSVTMGT